MNEIQWLKSLDRDKDQPIRVDVADQVLRDIRQRSHPAESGLPPLAALIAALAGAACIMIAVETWMNFQDPLASFVDSWRLVLQ
jgi:hypothetical protein